MTNINVYTLHNRIPKYMKQKLTRLERTDKISEQKQENQEEYR
jgi:hypothetical protein